MNSEGQIVQENQDSGLDENKVETATEARELELAALLIERDQLKDQLLRAMAEAQNVQRRLRSQMEEDRKFAARPLVERLLPVLDSFERSLQAATQGASTEAILDGFRLVEKQLRQALESVQVKRIQSVGSAYDVEQHEALATHVTDQHPEETVTDEIEPGYLMHGRVIRPAKVRVSKKP